MKAKDIMTGAVISIEPETTVLEAARRMLQNHISGLPVSTRRGPWSVLCPKVTFCDEVKRARRRGTPGYLNFCSVQAGPQANTFILMEEKFAR